MDLASKRVLVCGGRSFGRTAEEHRRLIDALWWLRPSFVIEGGATGADEKARAWRRRHGVPGETYAADWDDIDHPQARIKYVKGKPYNANAGPIRNAKMLAEGAPKLILAFPGGPGTRNMIDQAIKAGFTQVERPSGDNFSIYIAPDNQHK